MFIVPPILAFIYSTFCLHNVFGGFYLDDWSLYLRRGVFSVIQKTNIRILLINLRCEMVDRDLFMLEYIIGYVASDGREIYLPEYFCIPVGAETRFSSRSLCYMTP